MTYVARKLISHLVLAVLVAGAATSVHAHPASGVVVMKDGTICLAYGPSHRIWVVPPDGDPRVLVEGDLGSSFRAPHHLMLREEDGTEALYTAGDTGVVFRLTLDGTKTRVYPPADRDDAPRIGLGGDPFTLDADGNIVAAFRAPDVGKPCAIIRVGLDGTVHQTIGGPCGFADGPAEASRMTDLHGSAFALAPNGAVLFLDEPGRIRAVAPDGRVSTLGSLPDTTPGRLAGIAFAMSGDAAAGVTFTSATHRTGCRVVKLTYGIRGAPGSADPAVIAGGAAKGGADGPAERATFDAPAGVAAAPDGGLVVLELPWVDGKERVRLRRIASDGAVTTVLRIDQP